MPIPHMHPNHIIPLLETKTLKGLLNYGDGEELAQREEIRIDRQVRLKALLDQFQAEEDARDDNG